MHYLTKPINLKGVNRVKAAKRSAGVIGKKLQSWFRSDRKHKNATHSHFYVD
jgi:hypothetical protein